MLSWLFLHVEITVFNVLLLLMSLFPTWNRDFSKDPELGREVSSVGDVSSMKSKTVRAFYCLNFQLSLWTFIFHLICVGFLPKVWPDTSDNPIYYLCFNYSSLWQLLFGFHLIDKNICLSSYTVVVYGMIGVATPVL